MKITRYMLLGYCLLAMGTVVHGQTAEQIVKETGVSAGLAVRVGTTDGALEAGLTTNGKMLVQGLALSDEAAAKARKHIFDQKLYGLASVSRVQTVKTLPYYDRIVNLLVADLDTLGNDAPSMDEIQRVLGYEGVAYLKQGGQWTKTVKPTPKDVDTWTHTLHDASRDGVSKDRLAGPPNAVRWINGPPHRERTSGPRLSDGAFVMLAKPAGRIAMGAHPAVRIWARDVHSGVLLWTDEVAPSAYPTDQWGESFVAAEGRVYAYRLMPPKPLLLAAWNVRTGAIEKEFDRSVVLTPAPAGSYGRMPVSREDWDCLRIATVSVHNGKVIQTWKDGLYVMDAASGAVLWKKGAPAGSWWRYVCVADDALLALRGDASAGGKPWGSHAAVPTFEPKALECFSLADGARRWAFDDFGPGFQTMNGLAGCAGGKLPLDGFGRDPASKRETVSLMLLDARRGVPLWKVPGSNVGGEWHGLIHGDQLWCSEARGGATVYKLADGQVAWKFNVPHHQTCGVSALTPRYLINLRLFIPLDQPQVPPPRRGYPKFYTNRSIQNNCRDKLNPAYGSVYDLNQECGCEAFLPANSAYYAVPLTAFAADTARLQARGPGALGPVEPQRVARASRIAADWGKPKGAGDPWMISYRVEHLNWRSRTAPVWRAYEPNETEPIQVGKLTLVAYVQEHRLAATRDGKEVWNFIAGGRITAAPVIHGQRALFACHDGYVYAVNLADGSLAWRFLAAPADKRHVAFGQVESAWPVFNVVLHEGKLYCCAGRHAELDGGLHLYSLDPTTGAMHWHVKYLRGLATEKLTPEVSVAGSHWASHGATPTNPPNHDGSFVINDAIAIKDNKIYLRLLPMVDLADPKDTIINPQTLVPPEIRP
jgi:outer membrane protein assembly factor BamB